MAGGRQIIQVQSLHDPRIADYANLRDRQLRATRPLRLDEAALRPLPQGGEGQDDGLFIAEGELVVCQLIASGLTVRSVLLTPQRLATIGDALATLSPFTPIYLAEQPLMNQIVGFNIHRGILAAGRRPRPPDLDDLLPRIRSLVILEDLANHDNVGGIFRATAALAGLPEPPPGPEPDASSLRRSVSSSLPSGAAILLSPQCCDPLYRKSIRVSMGAALRLPFATLSPWPTALDLVKRHGFTLIALTPQGATDLGSARSVLPAEFRPALLLGAEGPGLSQAALAAADLRLRIPIDPRVDSLNVVTAAAIALHALLGDRPPA